MELEFYNMIWADRNLEHKFYKSCLSLGSLSELKVLSIFFYYGNFMLSFRTNHHAMENNSKCGICQTVFDKLVLLRKHVRVDHKLQYANHRCPHCRFGCYINTDLESHKVQKHPDLKQYHCEVCNTGRVFFSESDYQVFF